MSNLNLFDSATSAFPLFEEIQSTGMPASHTYFTALYDTFTSRMSQLSTTLSMAYFDDVPINPNSSKQTAQLCKLYNLTPTKRTKTTRVWSYAKGSIEHLRYAHPAMSLLFDWREVAHFRDSFVIPILHSMTPNNLHNDGVGDTYNIMGDLQITRTTSRRPSMKKSAGGINLLNLPSRQRIGMADGLSRSIRGGFIAPSDELLYAADLSQIELRILASVSNDPVLCGIFNNNLDPHTTMAMRMFGIANEHDVEGSVHRKPAKCVNFMIANGGSGAKMYEMFRQEGIEANWSVALCDDAIESWFRECRGVVRWMDVVLRNARLKGYVETALGMRRYLPDLWSKDDKLRSAAEREAINHIIQGTAQDVIQPSMTWIYNRLQELRAAGYKVKCALQVYDELIFRYSRAQDASDGLGSMLADIVIEGLTEHAGVRLNVPITADGSTGNSWGEL